MPFSIGSVIKKLHHIHCQISAKHQIPFPKPEAFWLSKYAYERRYIRIHNDGRLEGGRSRFVSSLVDFSFVRSIVAHKYSLIGFAYDPVSIFLLDLFRYLEKYPDMKTFAAVLRDWDQGRHYRLYAGINNRNIPCEATYTNFKERLGEELYNQIFHVLVEGRHFISNKNQILHHHGKVSKIHLADAKYDEINNYEFSRSQGAIPIIDYNPRSENLSPQALKTRGYDHKGWPYAPCGILTRPNGFDQKSQRASFSCRRKCVGRMIRRSDNTPKTANTGSTTTDLLVICRSPTSPG